jgi:6-phosphogluconolactonase
MWRAGPAPEGEPVIIVRRNAAAAAMAVAETLSEALAASTARRGRADFASTGGSAASAVYRALLAEPVRSRVPWDALHLWVGDDRFVPRSDRRSNMAPVDRVLLAGDETLGLAPAPLDPGHIHPWPTDAALAAGEGPAGCAARFETTLRAELVTDAAGRPIFDALLVGIGRDGHVLSVFPGSRAFTAPGWTTWAPASRHIQPRLDRVTLIPAVLDATPALVVAAFGAGKAAIVGELLGQQHDQAGPGERQLPALRARRAGARWILDTAAAAVLAAASEHRSRIAAT